MKADLKKLINRKGKISDCDSYKQFSVLIPIIESAEGHSLLFEVRSETLSQQPNEICFPGGRIEASEDSINAAIRETSEELLLPEDKINILGGLDILVTPFNTLIYPFTGILTDYKGTFSTDEVQQVFTVPLSFLIETEPLCHYIDVQLTPGDDFPFEMIQQGIDYPWRRGKYPVYFYEYDGKIIWGITARIIKNFIDILKGQD